MANEITVEQLAKLQQEKEVVFLDVREKSEHDAGHIPNSTLIPVGTLVETVNSQDSEAYKFLHSAPSKDKPLIVYCARGLRGARATQAIIQVCFYLDLFFSFVISNILLFYLI